MFKKIVGVLFIVVLLSGCQAKVIFNSSFNFLNEELDKVIDYLLVESKEKIYNLEPQKVEVKIVLTEESRKQIDTWLLKNSLNQYGDPEGITYSENPLYDKTTGAVKNRYQYIIENHPDLIEIFNLK